MISSTKKHFIFKNARWLYVLTAGLLLVNLLIGMRVYSQEAEEQNTKTTFEKVGILMRVFHLVRQDYVHKDEVAPEKLIYSAIRGMVDSLDPFSAFLSPKEYKEMQQDTKGKFGGIGIVVTMREGYLTVVTPLEGTPASKAGIEAGDRIVGVDGKDIREKSLRKSTDMLKGEPGTEVSLKIIREDEDEPLNVTLERAVIKVRAVKDRRMLTDNIGYVRITQFNKPTADRLKDSLNELQENGLRGLILDLRNNPGGLLKGAVEVSDLFLPPDRLVVSVKGRRPSQRDRLYTSSKEMLAGIPMVVLVNHGSASAAEIVAGCLRDWNEAVLVGTSTFGKGSVQNVVSLPDGSALRLTTAMYYTPSHQVIHEKGLTPDITVKLTKKEKEKLYKYQHSLGKTKETKTAYMDPQLQRAVDLLKHYDALQQSASRKPDKPDRESEPVKKK